MTRERLQKVLAAAGVASRREAERLILAGRVRVNGQTVRELGTSASLADDAVEVDGRLLGTAEDYEYYALCKPLGVVTTVHDPHRRPTVMGLLGTVTTARVYPVGRLDADSEGLLLLTNDGQLAYRLTHPRFGVEKEYEVELDRPAGEADLDRIRRGIESFGELLRPREIRPIRRGNGTQLAVVLAEGKKREVRRLFQAAGYRVLRLVRVRFGPITLGGLRPGAVRPLTNTEVDRLRAATLG